jgi:hypothetical protein
MVQACERIVFADVGTLSAVPSLLCDVISVMAEFMADKRMDARYPPQQRLEEAQTAIVA